MQTICNYLGYIFLSYCLHNTNNPKLTPKTVPHKFHLEFQWQYINFTWRSPTSLRKALDTGHYIPQNVAISGMRAHLDHIYLTLPKYKPGVPVTLGRIHIARSPRLNAPIEPYPSWQLATASRDCLSLESVQSMEIEPVAGHMWVLDGTRINNLTHCPPKLVILDLSAGRTLQTYIFPNHVILAQGGYLNDIVVDPADGGHAYMTDNSQIDPGLVVYSRRRNTAWKLRDATMFGNKNGAGFVVNGRLVGSVQGVDGIALSPLDEKSGERTLYYTIISGFEIYSIRTGVLKNSSLFVSGEWRRSVQLVGKKQSQGDGMMMDAAGNLYYSLLPISAVGVWNMRTPFSDARIFDQNKEMLWPDGFSIDNNGNLRLMADSINRFTDPGELQFPEGIIFRLFKAPIGVGSYLTNTS